MRLVKFGGRTFLANRVYATEDMIGWDDRGEKVSGCYVQVGGVRYTLSKHSSEEVWKAVGDALAQPIGAGLREMVVLT